MDLDACRRRRRTVLCVCVPSLPFHPVRFRPSSLPPVVDVGFPCRTVPVVGRCLARSAVCRLVSVAIFLSGFRPRTLAIARDFLDASVPLGYFVRLPRHNHLANPSIQSCKPMTSSVFSFFSGRVKIELCSC